MELTTELTTDKHGNLVAIESYGEGYIPDVYIYQKGYVERTEVHSGICYRVSDATQSMLNPKTVRVIVYAVDRKTAKQIGKDYLGLDKVRVYQYR